MLKLRHAARFPEPNSPKTEVCACATWQALLRDDSGPPRSLSPFGMNLSMVKARSYKWRPVRSLHPPPTTLPFGCASTPSTGAVMHQRKEKQNKRNTWKNVTFANFRRGHLQDRLDHQREVASSPFDPPSLENAASAPCTPSPLHPQI